VNDLGISGARRKRCVNLVGAAARTGTTERYVRELLEHHAAECVARCFVSTPFQARFSEVEVLPIDTDYWRFYRLHG